MEFRQYRVMKSTYHRFMRQATMMLAMVFVVGPVAAEDVYVPPDLDEWREWVLAEHPDVNCPVDDLNERRMSCIWTTDLSVTLATQDRRLRFRLRGQAKANDAIAIPHGTQRPYAVELNRNPAQVGFLNGVPSVYVDDGPFDITGQIDFEVVPQTIQVPRDVAIVRLEIDGETVAMPRLEKGELWLQRHTPRHTASNSLRLAVFRKLIDDIPQKLETRIRLTVDGNDRVETLGHPIFEGFSATTIDADIPVQVRHDGEFLVQVSRGENWLTIHAESDQIINEFSSISRGTAWPGFETWVVEGNSQHRTVDVEGAVSVDPILVESPFGSAPTYRVNIGTTLALTNERRGDPNPLPPSFRIERQMWLGFDGEGVVAADDMQVESTSETRLTTDYPLGSVKVDGENRLITRLLNDAGSEAGITLHPSDRRVASVSLISPRSDLAANGWHVDSDSLRIFLHVPPGWKLLWTSGVDRVNESWLSSWWNLWDIFICVLIVVVLYRVGGIPLASIVTIALLLGYQEQFVPALGWLMLGLLLLLDRQIRSPSGKRVLEIVFWLAAVPVAIASVYVAANNFRQAVYPQLADELWRTAPAVNVQHRDAMMPEKQLEELSVSGNFEKARAPLRRIQIMGESAAGTADTTSPTSSAASQIAVQTGPGKPRWYWDQVTLDWVGPVPSDQRIGLTFLPPPVMRIVFVLIGVLHLLLLTVLLLAKTVDRIELPPWMRRVSALLLLGIASSSANASFPESELLRELETRLTAFPECAPGCASVERASLKMVDADELRVELTLLSGARIALPLPKNTPRTALKAVTQGGQGVPLIYDNEQTYIEVRSGQNQVTLTYDLRELDDLVIDFPLEAARITTDVCCWRVSKGVDAKHQRVVLNRKHEDEDETPLSESNYAFSVPVVVSRDLRLGFEPSVATTVRVHGDRTEAIVVEVPLLNGETIVESSRFVAVQDSVAIISFEPNERSESWFSSIRLEDELTLRAPESVGRTEQWFVRGSDFWHFNAEGVIPSQSDRDGTVYFPRKGESLRLTLSQPTPLEGETVTIQSVGLTANVGARAAQHVATFQIDASVAGNFTVDLPQGSTVERVTIDGEELPLGTGTSVVLPVTHGEHQYGVNWRLNEQLGWFYRTPSLTLGENASNVTQTVQMAKNRWVLFLGGPAIGSAVLFWGVVIVTVLVALALSLLPKFPLSRLDAVLVAVGATLANIWALLFVALWTLSIWWRARTPLDSMSTIGFRVVQIVLGVLAFIGLMALIYTVVSALLTPPEMYISSSSMFSNFSSTIPFNAHVLQWFADVSQGELPTAWVFSLPFWVYQLTMLAWSLWLVLALIKWVKSTFAAMSVPTYWRKDDSIKQSEGDDWMEQPSEEATEQSETEEPEGEPDNRS